jgi:hypothetical protein
LIRTIAPHSAKGRWRTAASQPGGDLGGLCAALLLCRVASLLQRFPELFRLQFEDLGLLRGRGLLVAELLPLQLEHGGLVADLPGLFPEGEPGQHRRNDRESREYHVRHGGELPREDLRHGESLSRIRSAKMSGVRPRVVSCDGDSNH